MILTNTELAETWIDEGCLVFDAICTPRFVPAAYEDVEHLFVR